MNYFIFKGIESTELGVIVEKPPEIPLGIVRSETQKVIGSAKVLHYTEGDDAMDPVTVALECALVRPDEDAIRKVCAWLRGGGELVTPAEPDRSYRAWVKGQISLEQVMRLRPDRRFTVQFECEAFRYHYPAARPKRYTAPCKLRNSGTAPAEPLIKVLGSGNNTLMIGDSSIAIDGMTDYVMLDCQAQIAYRENVNWGSRITRAGDWPRIPTEGCMISWTSGITGVEITPRWRDY